MQTILRVGKPASPPSHPTVRSCRTGIAPAALIAFAWSALVATAGLAQSSEAPSPDDRRRQVERLILAPVVPVADLGKAVSLLERMATSKVPGLSLAVIEDGEIAWARGYGTKEVDGKQPIEPETLLLAGSISKPVAATVGLRMAQEGALQLDRDVNEQLESWKVPYPELAGDEKVTMRRLLSHSAGLTVHGFPGYPKDAAIPSGPQILDGVEPANTGPVRIDLVPGSEWRYSGGGYTVFQVLVEDVSGMGFAEVAREKVLRPFGMTSSTFANPLPSTLHEQAAIGHWPTGVRVPSRWHTYPEMAAAGLWTTATDLARWAIGIQDAFSGGSEAVLNQEWATTMLEEQINEWGLGPAVAGEGEALRFSHGGRDAGYDALLIAYPRTGQGAVAMINANNNSGFLSEVMETIARVYDWPGERAQQRGYIELTKKQLDAVAGRYEFTNDNERVNFRRKDGALHAVAQSFGRIVFYPESENEFFDGSGRELIFRKSSDGTWSHFEWRRGDTTFPGKRVD